MGPAPRCRSVGLVAEQVSAVKLTRFSRARRGAMRWLLDFSRSLADHGGPFVVCRVRGFVRHSGPGPPFNVYSDFLFQIRPLTKSYGYLNHASRRFFTL